MTTRPVRWPHDILRAAILPAAVGIAFLLGMAYGVWLQRWAHPCPQARTTQEVMADSLRTVLVGMQPTIQAVGDELAAIEEPTDARVRWARGEGL